MEAEIAVIVNGDERRLRAGSTITDLLAEMNLGSRWVIVERNGEPCPRDEHERTTLYDADRIELVRAVAGG